MKTAPELPYLRVKIKSLAAEAKIIRAEESKKKNSGFREGLHNHRVVDVRREQRATLLAYGYLRGKSLQEIEKTTLRIPYYTRDRVRRMVEKYGTREQLASFAEWLTPKKVEVS